MSSCYWEFEIRDALDLDLVQFFPLSFFLSGADGPLIHLLIALHVSVRCCHCLHVCESFGGCLGLATINNLRDSGEHVGMGMWVCIGLIGPSCAVGNATDFPFPLYNWIHMVGAEAGSYVECRVPVQIAPWLCAARCRELEWQLRYAWGRTLGLH